MKNRPKIILCPNCGAWRVSRRYKACGKCKTGLKFGNELVFEGDWYYKEGKGWITYDELMTYHNNQS